MKLLGLIMMVLVCILWAVLIGPFYLLGEAICMIRARREIRPAPRVSSGVRGAPEPQAGPAEARPAPQWPPLPEAAAQGSRSRGPTVW